jgi:hypothetical protein
MLRRPHLLCRVDAVDSLSNNLLERALASRTDQI